MDPAGRAVVGGNASFTRALATARTKAARTAAVRAPAAPFL